MRDAYYYADAQGNPAGPISGAELLRLAQGGVLRADTPVIQEGASGWSTLAEAMVGLGPAQGSVGKRRTDVVAVVAAPVGAARAGAAGGGDGAGSPGRLKAASDGKRTSRKRGVAAGAEARWQLEQRYGKAYLLSRVVKRVALVVEVAAVLLAIALLYGSLASAAIVQDGMLADFKGLVVGVGISLTLVVAIIFGSISILLRAVAAMLQAQLDTAVHTGATLAVIEASSGEEGGGA